MVAVRWTEQSKKGPPPACTSVTSGGG